MKSDMTIISATAAALINSVVGAGTIVYDQPLDAPNLGGGFFSSPQRDAFVPNLHADNFTLSEAADIMTVGWHGFSENFNFPDLTNMSAWEITIYDDSSFQPGNVIHSEIIPKENTNPTEVGSDTARGVRIFVHDAELSASVSLEAGTQYWISIGAILEDPGGDNWVWHHAVLIDDNSANYDTVEDDGWFNVGFDSAFSLGVIPGPGGLAMLGAAGLIGRGRRRG